MREQDFSIPNANRAAVCISTALYDRRALDSTSKLPIINSLNHLAYLTTSSARIRDILTLDGGVERLVDILKSGRERDQLSLWRWNLAFQCVVNIGVRGSETVRSRVVEAEMIPVIATILQNFIMVHDRCREKQEHELRRKQTQRLRVNSSASFSRSSTSDGRLHRRQAPPSIEIPPSITPVDPNAMDITPTRPHSAANATTERFARPVLTHHHSQPHTHNRSASHSHHRHHAHHHHNRSIDGGRVIRPLAAAINGERRDIDRLPSMLGAPYAGLVSNPDSPTTPGAFNNIRSPIVASVTSPLATESPMRPAFHQRSASNESENAEETPSDNDRSQAEGAEPIVDVQADTMLPDAPMVISDVPDAPEAETFNITHRSPVDGSILNGPGNTTPTAGLSPVPNIPNPQPIAPYARYMGDGPSSAGLLINMPREEDVLMSLQLLAYVSKYCNLRAYFQNSHLVPKLRVDNEMYLLDDVVPTAPPPAIIDMDAEEYLIPEDYNIFPLVEKFTVRHHSPDMQYWAGVVMRNLCRKDDSRGGIRQCAYYQCGKWEEYTRQFAKCRRCRRTKYCSKDCQKSAWVFHRHWCVAAAPP